MVGEFKYSKTIIPMPPQTIAAAMAWPMNESGVKPVRV